MDEHEADDGWWRRVWVAGAVSVLAVSEDPSWPAGPLARLAVEGYAVRLDPGGEAVMEPGCPFDVALVDLALAGRSPVAVCRLLRSRADMPILGVSAYPVPEGVVLDVLAAGADRVATPVEGPGEVVARVRSLLRRHPPRGRVSEGGAGGAVQVDLARSTATVAGRTVALTQPECELLHLLVQNPGRVVRRSELGEDPGRGRSDQALDALVRRVRTKLEVVEGRRRIVAVRGVGFRFLAGDHVEPTRVEGGRGAPALSSPGPGYGGPRGGSR